MEYDRLGIYPWFSIRAHRDYGYDPLFVYYRWQMGRRDPAWVEKLEGWHRYYRTHPDQRPPHDLAAQRQLMAHATGRADRQYLKIADTAENWRKRPNAPVGLESVSAAQKVEIQRAGHLMHESAAQRVKLETQIGRREGAAMAIKTPQKERLPKMSTEVHKFYAANEATVPKGNRDVARPAAGVQKERVRVEDKGITSRQSNVLPKTGSAGAPSHLPPPTITRHRAAESPAFVPPHPGMQRDQSSGNDNRSRRDPNRKDKDKDSR